MARIFDPQVRMQDPINSVILFAILCASAGVGFFVHPRLPEKHRSAQAMGLVQLAITLLVTFTAIVLGLLTTSVKAGFNNAYNARGDYAGQLAQMDRCLRDYGPTASSVHSFGRYVAAVIASTWPDEPRPTGVTYPDTSKMPLTGESSVLADLMNDVGLETRSLQRRRRAQDPDGRLRRAISRPHPGALEGDRGRARVDLNALLLGPGVLARDFVRHLWADGDPEPDGRDGDRVMRAVDHRLCVCNPRYGRALWRLVRHSEHVNAKRARRHDALSEPVDAACGAGAAPDRRSTVMRLSTNTSEMPNKPEWAWLNSDGQALLAQIIQRPVDDAAIADSCRSEPSPLPDAMKTLALSASVVRVRDMVS